MRTIYKYPLTLASLQVLKVPGGDRDAKALTVQMQDGKPMLWVEVETDMADAEFRVFASFTGEVMHSKADRHVGTITLDDFVFHIHAPERT